MTTRPGMLGATFPAGGRMNMDNDSLLWLKQNVICSPKTFVDATAFTSTLAGSPGTMFTTTFPAGFFSQLTEGFEFIAWGATAATANNKQIKAIFAGTTIFDSLAAAANNKSWYAQGFVIRNASGGFTTVTQGVHNGATIFATRAAVTSIDFTTALTFTMQYTAATADGDVVYDGCIINFLDQINFTTGV